MPPDHAAHDGVDRWWLEVVSALGRRQGVTVVAPAAEGGRRRFGSNSLRVNNRIFAMVASQGRFVVKLPAPRVAEILAAGKGDHFEAGGKRWMKEWVSMAPGTETEWISLATEAMTFVGRAA